MLCRVVHDPTGPLKHLTAFTQLAYSCYDELDQSLDGVHRWIGRLEDIGVCAVLLQEDRDTPTLQGVRAENLNRTEIPQNLQPN